MLVEVCKTDRSKVYRKKREGNCTSQWTTSRDRNIDPYISAISHGSCNWHSDLLGIRHFESRKSDYYSFQLTRHSEALLLIPIMATKVFASPGPSYHCLCYCPQMWISCTSCSGIRLAEDSKSSCKYSPVTTAVMMKPKTIIVAAILS